jgi:regulator of sirC expression with transglutaminase-like and TPR domain
MDGDYPGDLDAGFSGWEPEGPLSELPGFRLPSTGACSEESTETLCPSRVKALVRLLGDEDPKICSVAWQHLERMGVPVLPYVRKALQDAPDARVQVQCQRFLTEWTRREALRRWATFSKGGPLQLEDGVFLLAATEYPEVDMIPFRRRLDDFASTLRGRIATVRSTDEAVARIADFLFGEVGFRGNSEDYYSSENSYLNRVLDRRLGIPISLSALFLLVARRLSVPMHGVGLPRHFVLKFRGRSGEVFVDPFHGGRFLSTRDCLRFLSKAQIPYLADCLRAVTDAEIITRMLGNLLRIYLNAGDQRRYDRISLMLKVMA